MAFCWQADDGPTLNTGLVFQGIRTSIAKKPYIFVIFQGGGGGGLDPMSPPPDPHMDYISCHVPVLQFSQI